MIFGSLINNLNNNEYILKEEDDYTMDNKLPDNDSSNDVSSEDNSDYTMDDEPPSEDTDSNESENDNQEDESNDDYTMDDENNTEEEDVSEDPDDDSMDSSDNSIENELVEKEKELFNKLSEEELRIKNAELKDNFKKMYNIIDDIKTKVQRIPTNQSIKNVIDFINNKLNETQQHIEHYLYYNFELKSYIQNAKQYNIYLLILKNVEKLFLEIAPKTNN